MNWMPVVLLGVAGFLIGGVYVAYRTAKALAGLLLLGALLAGAAGVIWML